MLVSCLVACSHTARARQSSSSPPGSPAVASSSSAIATPARTPPPSTAASVRPGTVPRYAHIVLVVEENHGSSQIIGSSAAPYLNSLTQSGLRLTNMHAETHPSEPNYVALFSGSTQGLESDSCPRTFAGGNLAAPLAAADRSFVGYAESLPSPGFTGCASGPYARKHAPWTDFSSVPASDNQPMTAFPTDFAQLPAVAFVIPNLNDDMHDGTVAQADTWLRQHLSGYADWALTHDSLLIVTWDEDEGSENNHIPTVLSGASLIPGTDSQPSTHYTLLRLIEDSLGLPNLGNAAAAAPLVGTWQK
ncbi:MAG: acid phosphatase [Actinobacteria bacterium]|nr:acid phosphatase [Actinomycetota bacterium]